MSDQFIIEWLRQIYLPLSETTSNRMVSGDGSDASTTFPASSPDAAVLRTFASGSSGFITPQNYMRNIPSQNHENIIANLVSELRSQQLNQENTERTRLNLGQQNIEDLAEFIINSQRTSNQSRTNNNVENNNRQSNISNLASLLRQSVHRVPENQMQSERDEYRNQNNTHTTTPLSFPEFDELMYLYHRNIQEYQYTIQEMTERIEINTRRNSRQHNMVLDNLVYPYNRNMQEYNQVTLRCLDVLQSMYALSTHERRQPPDQSVPRNSTVPSNNFIPPHANNSTTFIGTTDGRTMRPSPINSTFHTQQISRPLEFGFTLFPNVINLPNNVPRNTSSVTTPTLLTPEQIARTTREYIFQESDRNTLDASTTFTASSPNATVLRTSALGSTSAPAPICPIMLEEFQPGNNIRQITHCGHHFLSSSLTRWFRRSSCCPVCRYNLWDISAQEPQLFTGRTSNSSTMFPASLRNSTGVLPTSLTDISSDASTAFSASGSNTVISSDASTTFTASSPIQTEGLSRLPPEGGVPNATVLRTFASGSNSRANSIGDIVPVSREELSRRQTSSLINSYFSGHYPLDRETDIQRVVNGPIQRPEPDSVQGHLDPSEGEDTPFLDFQSTNMEGAETSIRNWITSFINSNQPGMFPNMDLDISYTVEYDYPTDSSGQRAERLLTTNSAGDRRSPNEFGQMTDSNQ